MTNDQQQVEAWRSEFEEASEKLGTNYSKIYTKEYQWQGFLMAKRNQPVIELPAIESPEGYYEHAEVFEAITAAGYSYRVKS